MHRMFTIFACLFCVVLNASADSMRPIEKLSRPTIDSDIQVNEPSAIARGFKPPKMPKVPKGGHVKNKRESSRNKHENADARRQREQQKAAEKQERNRK